MSRRNEDSSTGGTAADTPTITPAGLPGSRRAGMSSRGETSSYGGTVVGRDRRRVARVPSHRAEE